jgi:hypothetical protein
METERRSPILVFFTFLANAYLVAFALDAAVSLVDEIWFAASGVSPLTEARNSLALFVVLASLVMIFVVAFTPQLPKLIFVPMIAAAMWFAVGAPPFVAATGDRTVSLFLALIQLIIATGAFLIVQLRMGGTLLSARLLPYKSHLFLRIALASFVIVALIPVGLAALGAWALVSSAEAQTKGYLTFTWSEIQTREAVMRSRTKTVHLIATAHIAEAGFYEAIYKGIPPHAVILAEGITDEKGLLGGDRARGEAASFLGLQTQEVFEQLLGPTLPDEAAKASAPSKQKEASAPAKTRPDVVRADIDVSELSQPTLRCLREDLQFGNAALSGKDTDLPTPTCTEADRKVFWDEILYTRNAKVMASFDALAERYDVFVVPWGALHMPDLQASFEKRGFRVERTRLLTLARYQTVAGNVFAGLSAFKLKGPANRPYEIRANSPHQIRTRWSGGR